MLGEGRRKTLGFFGTGGGTLGFLLSNSAKQDIVILLGRVLLLSSLSGLLGDGGSSSIGIPYSRSNSGRGGTWLWSGSCGAITDVVIDD